MAMLTQAQRKTLLSSSRQILYVCPTPHRQSHRRMPKGWLHAALSFLLIALVGLVNAKTSLTLARQTSAVAA